MTSSKQAIDASPDMTRAMSLGLIRLLGAALKSVTIVPNLQHELDEQLLPPTPGIKAVVE